MTIKTASANVCTKAVFFKADGGVIKETYSTLIDIAET